jgi:N-formylglutamate amidohydrolase
MKTEIYELHRGGSPLILSIPHCGQELPRGFVDRMTPAGRSLIDTDWWLERLYGFAHELDATILQARLSRYVIDLNRDPAGVSLYPGQATTELVPTTTFDGEPIYLPGAEPSEAAIADRRRLYFDPYHAALSSEIARVKARHGYALLYDCHSIRSVIPRLFEGTLPVFNLGTNSGRSCAQALQQQLADVLAGAKAFDHVVNGRFKGGWITRHYGRPADGVHAVQLELACRAYMQETPPYAYDEAKAMQAQPILRALLTMMLAWGKSEAR